MMNFRLIGAAALSLMLATPAMAMHHGYRHHYAHVSHRVSGAYALDRGYDFAPGNVYNDFDRRNTFN
jgi:hypothetical protein